MNQQPSKQKNYLKLFLFLFFSGTYFFLGQYLNRQIYEISGTNVNHTLDISFVSIGLIVISGVDFSIETFCCQRKKWYKLILLFAIFWESIPFTFIFPEVKLISITKHIGEMNDINSLESQYFICSLIYMVLISLCSGIPGSDFMKKNGRKRKLR